MRNFKCIALLCLITTVIALGHHSAVMFDRSKEVSVTGIVKDFSFTNPHVSIQITVTAQNGTTTDWSFEAASTRGMVNAGWRKSSIKAGDTVTLVGHPLKDGRPGAQLMKAILSDGTVLASSGGENY